MSDSFARLNFISGPMVSNPPRAHGYRRSWRGLLAAWVLLLPTSCSSQTAPGHSISTRNSPAPKAIDVNKILSQAAQDALEDERYGFLLLKDIAELRAKTGDFDGAHGTIRLIDNPYSAAGTLKFVAVKQAEAGDLKAALKTAEMIRENFDDAIAAYSKIAEIQTKAGDRDSGKDTFEKAIRLAIKETPGATKEIRSHTSRRISLARNLREIASSQIRVNERRAAIELLGQALEAISKSDPGELKSFRDPVSQVLDPALVKIADTYAQAGDIGGALKAVDTIKTQDRKKAALLAIVRAVIGDGKTKEAHLLTTLVGNNPDFQRELRIRIMTEQARLGDIQGALQTLETYYDSYWDRYLFHIVTAQIKAKDRESALRTAEKVKGNISDLGRIAVAYAEAGHKKRAQEILQRALDNIRDESQETASPIPSYALSSLASAQAKTGDYDGALQTIDRIQDSYRQVRELIKVAKTQIESGDRSGAENTFQRAKQSAGSLSETRWMRADALTAIGLAQATAGHRLAAGQTLAEAVESAVSIRDFLSQPRLVSRAALAQAEIGDVKEALQAVTSHLTLPAQKGDAFREIARIQARRGEFEAALAWINAQERPLRARALLGLAEGAPK